MRPNREFGQVRPPTSAQLQEYGARHHFTFDDGLAADLVPVIAGMLKMFDALSITHYELVHEKADFYNRQEVDIVSMVAVKP